MGSSVLPCSFWLQNSGVTQMPCNWRVIPCDKRFKLIVHLWAIDKICQLHMVSSLDALVVINDRSGVPWPVLLYGYYKLATNDRKVEKYPPFYCDHIRIVQNCVYYYYFLSKCIHFYHWVSEQWWTFNPLI